MHQAFVLPEGAYGEPVLKAGEWGTPAPPDFDGLAPHIRDAAGRSWLVRQADYLYLEQYDQSAALPRVPTPPDDRPRLTATMVYHMADVLLMGAIRNRQRASFANDTTPINDDRQRAWWAAQRNRVRAWLYTDDAGETVGYGLLRQTEDGRWWTSVAVLDRFAGNGYGGAITHHLVNAVPHEVWAEARNDNPAAVRLHNGVEWETLGADNDRTYFRTKPKVRATQLGYGLEG